MPEKTVWVDGVPVDPETGEVLDVPTRTPLEPTEECIERILEKIADYRFQADIHRQKRDLVVNQLNPQIKRAEASADYWEAQLKPVAEEFFNANKPKGKKSIAFAYGTIGTREQKEKWELPTKKDDIAKVVDFLNAAGAKTFIRAETTYKPSLTGAPDDLRAKIQKEFAGLVTYRPAGDEFFVRGGK